MYQFVDMIENNVVSITVYARSPLRSQTRSFYDLHSCDVFAPVRSHLVRWDHKWPNGAWGTGGSGDRSEANFIL